jgi:hypothetical protein
VGTKEFVFEEPGSIATRGWSGKTNLLTGCGALFAGRQRLAGRLSASKSTALFIRLRRLMISEGFAKEK